MDIVSCLERLSGAVGVGGLTDAADAAEELLRPYCDGVERDALGSVIGVKHGKKPRAENEKAPVLLLEAHIDEIGMVVVTIDDAGFVRVSACGGIDRRTLDAAEVVVYGDRPFAGVFCSTPPHLRKKEEKEPLCEIGDLGIDVGLDAEEAGKHIRPGDRVSFRPNFRKIGENRVTGKALDDRSGVTAILHCLDVLQKAGGGELPFDIAVVFAVQEELGCRGSAVSAFRTAPDAAIAVDVSFGYTPGVDRVKCGELGGGPMIGWAPGLDDAMTRRLAALADENGLPYQHEVMGGNTGTDADSIADARTGTRTALLSLPLRYMHTPVELLDVRDVDVTGRLMADFIRQGGAMA